MDIAQPLRDEWGRCAVEGTPLAVLTVAPDNPADGEDNLWCQELKRALRVHCGRGRDVVVDRGAGSFVVALPDTLPPGARHVGERIVEAMRHTPRPDGTVSVGVAGVVPSESDEVSTLLARSANALRFAKDQGGDRCAGGGVPSPPSGKPISRLSDLLAKSSPDPGRQRRTD